MAITFDALQFQALLHNRSLKDWYMKSYGKTGKYVDEMAPFIVTHTCSEKTNLLIVQYQGEQFICKIMPGGEGIMNEYAAHDVLDPLNCPHIIKIEKRIVVDTHFRGGFLTKMYNQYDRSILRPFTKVIMRQLFQALSVIHANNIVHLDIKPQNFVWEWKDGVPHIYVIDFALSLKTTQKWSFIAGQSAMTGTWIYMAPERFECRRPGLPDDFRTNDNWSAGIIFAELLLDRVIFTEISAEILTNFIKNIDVHFQEVDPLALDLLKHLLTYYSNRYTADQALSHRYFE